MPELVPTWEHIRDLCADHESADEVAHLLTLWNPPPFAPGCSQLVVGGPERALIRNYDYHPDLFEAVSASTQWSERRVIGTSDCLWGLLDGMNDGGLAVSLTFGGVTGTGAGFAIPLVVRYLLEVCDSVEEARQVLGRMPVAGHYNLTLSDRAGTHTTAFVGPDRSPEFLNLGQATNHRGLVPDNPELARRFRSVERQDTLISLQRREATSDQAVGEFLSPSLRSVDFEGGFGTLYTAEYRPAEEQLVYHWPGTTWKRGFDSPSEQIVVRLQ
jgi:predicted choloylglycine hydrolase